MGQTTWTGAQLGYALSGCRLESGNLLLDWAQHAADANTLVLYHANEGTGVSVADSSGNGNTGTLTTGNWYGGVPWLGAGAMGASDVLTPGTLPTLGVGDWTTESWVWVNANNNDNVARAFHRYRGPSSQLFNITTRHTSGAFRFVAYLRDNAAHATGDKFFAAESLVGTWAHWAVVRDGNTLRMYLNGVQVTTHDITGYTFSAWTSTNGWNSDAYLTGIDEMRDSNLCRYPNGTTFYPTRYPASGTGTANPATAVMSKPGLLTVTLSEALPAGTSLKAKLLSTTGGDTGFQLLTGSGTSYSYDFTGAAAGTWYPAVQLFAGGSMNANTPTVVSATLDWTESSQIVLRRQFSFARLGPALVRWCLP